MNPVNEDRENLLSSLSFEEMCCLTVFLLFFKFFLVDNLFKDANVGSDGRIYYEEFTKMVTLPTVDY